MSSQGQRSFVRSILEASAAAAIVALTACATDDVAVERLSTLASTSIASENQYVRSVRDYDCRTQALQGVVEAANQHQPWSVKTSCTMVLSDVELAERENSLKAVLVYAAALQELVGSTKDNELDPAAKDLATQIGAAAKQPALASLEPGSGVVTALTSIADWALGRIIYKDAKEAAGKEEMSLETVVGILKEENANLEMFRSSSAIQRGSAVQSILAASPPSPGAPPAPPVPPAQIAMQTWTIADAAGLIPGSSERGAFANVKQLNARLDDLVKCNKAIAGGVKKPEGRCAVINPMQQPTQ